MRPSLVQINLTKTALVVAREQVVLIQERSQGKTAHNHQGLWFLKSCCHICLHARKAGTCYETRAEPTDCELSHTSHMTGIAQQILPVLTSALETSVDQPIFTSRILWREVSPQKFARGAGMSSTFARQWRSSPLRQHSSALRELWRRTAAGGFRDEVHTIHASIGRGALQQQHRKHWWSLAQCTPRGLV